MVGDESAVLMVRTMAYSVREKICRMLNVRRQLLGGDFKTLAGSVEMSNEDIKLISDRIILQMKYYLGGKHRTLQRWKLFNLNYKKWSGMISLKFLKKVQIFCFLSDFAVSRYQFK